MDANARRDAHARDDLAQLGVDPRRVAVEHNLMVIKKAHYDTTQIQDGDQVEIVNFVGGGSLQ